MTPARKPPTSTTQRTRLPLAPVRRAIWEAARDLVVTGDAREISGVLANRFSSSGAIIDRVLVLEGMRHERIAATLRTGVSNALDMAREAADREEAA